MSFGQAMSATGLGGALAVVGGRIIAVKWPGFMGATPEDVSSMQGALQIIFVAVAVSLLYLARAVMAKLNLREPPDPGDHPPV